MTVASFRQLLEQVPKRDTQQELLGSFRDICMQDYEFMACARDGNSLTEKTNVEDSLRGRNYDLNRYCDILPFNYNRVRLQGKHDYINASHIELPPNISSNKYLATQGPLNHSIGDFWRMAWEQGSQAIIMLANPVEKSRNKCAVYWPAQVGNSTRAGDITVTLADERPLDGCVGVIKRSITLAHKSYPGQTRAVTQLHYKEWPDEGVPASPLPILRIVEEVRASTSPSATVPVTVHCSAGVGRTGTFIVIDSAMDYFAKNKDYGGDFVLDCVKSLRSQRTLTVQTFAQFVFCYQVIDFMLRNPR
ncbi:hypothetical protein GGI12_000078 [Dipsacomyces acuminosporus]|nr:hypothetical protein GGI12_000078 [Dipsacomyces acuminosporus]